MTSTKTDSTHHHCNLVLNIECIKCKIFNNLDLKSLYICSTVNSSWLHDSQQPQSAFYLSTAHLINLKLNPIPKRFNRIEQLIITPWSTKFRPCITINDKRQKFNKLNRIIIDTRDDPNHVKDILFGSVASQTIQNYVSDLYSLKIYGQYNNNNFFKYNSYTRCIISDIFKRIKSCQFSILQQVSLCGVSITYYLSIFSSQSLKKLELINVEFDVTCWSSIMGATSRTLRDATNKNVNNNNNTNKTNQQQLQEKTSINININNNNKDDLNVFSKLEYLTMENIHIDGFDEISQSRQWSRLASTLKNVQYLTIGNLTGRAPYEYSDYQNTRQMFEISVLDSFLKPLSMVKTNCLKSLTIKAIALQNCQDMSQNVEKIKMNVMGQFNHLKRLCIEYDEK